MSTLGNLIWFFLGGFIVAALYFIAGLLLCCTVIGIPFGVQLIKIGGVALCPFGRDVDVMGDSGCLSVVFNVIWIFLGWWEIALTHLFFALIFAITIVGIPFAKAHWRLMKMSLLPFGTVRI